MHKKHQECINGRPTQRQRQKLSSGRRRIFTISENKPTDIPFYFVLLQSRAVPEAVWSHLFRGSKGESSPKILFLRFRTVPENRRERGGASTRVQIGEPFAVPPTWDTKGQYWPRCETCNEACAGRKEMWGGGEFNQSWPSARSLVTPKVLFPCAISPDRGSVARMANLLQSLISCTVTCTF